MLGTGDSADSSVLSHALQRRAVDPAGARRPHGLSRPTISEAVRRLAGTGLIVSAGVRRGGLGRVPTCYRIAPDAGYVVAIDIGGDNLRIAAADVGGAIHYEHRQATRATGGRRVATQAARMIRAAAASVGDELGPLLRVGVSAPGVIHADGRTMSFAHNLGDDGPFDLLTPLEAAVSAPVVLDNNVNLAAVGERWRGHARDVATFAFLSVGAGIGMGLVHNGEVVRGAHGAAGEVAYLPLPGALPHAQRAGTRQGAARGRSRWLRHPRGAARPTTPGRGTRPRPRTVAELFAQAADGVAAARELVEAEGPPDRPDHRQRVCGLRPGAGRARRRHRQQPDAHSRRSRTSSPRGCRFRRGSRPALWARSRR